jgi:hypothetical protein
MSFWGKTTKKGKSEKCARKTKIKEEKGSIGCKKLSKRAENEGKKCV